jgi:GT2 family glycosyltransferase
MTLACLHSYFSQDAPDTELRAVMVDDGSSDGTGDAVSAAFAATEVLRAVGDLFWARGMAVTGERAIRSDPDYLRRSPVGSPP